MRQITGSGRRRGRGSAHALVDDRADLGRVEWLLHAEVRAAVEEGSCRLGEDAAGQEDHLAGDIGPKTYERARRLAGSGVTANVLHPGVAARLWDVSCELTGTDTAAFLREDET